MSTARRSFRHYYVFRNFKPFPLIPETVGEKTTQAKADHFRPPEFVIFFHGVGVFRIRPAVGTEKCVHCRKAGGNGEMMGLEFIYRVKYLKRNLRNYGVA